RGSSTPRPGKAAAVIIDWWVRAKNSEQGPSEPCRDNPVTDSSPVTESVFRKEIFHFAHGFDKNSSKTVLTLHKNDQYFSPTEQSRQNPRNLWASCRQAADKDFPLPG
ncbi:hypothetical protein P7K49_015031, partial [Saguinus oedipus]